MLNILCFRDICAYFKRGQQVNHNKRILEWNLKNKPNVTCVSPQCVTYVQINLFNYTFLVDEIYIIKQFNYKLHTLNKLKYSFYIQQKRTKEVNCPEQRKNGRTALKNAKYQLFYTFLFFKHHRKCIIVILSF